jgi:hypothetical protein
MRQNFTEEEWTKLLQAPMEAVMAVCLADKVDPISFLQELIAGVKIVTEDVKRTDLPGELIPALVAAMSEMDAQEPLAGEQLILKKQFELLGIIQTFKKPKDARDRAVGSFQAISAILDTKVTGAQATEFKTWLMSVAQRVAEYQREGGFLGVGGSRISERESDVLKALAQALGLTP